MKNDKEESEEEALFDFERFDVYKRAVDFADKIFEFTERFPKSQEHILSSQLSRI